MPILKKDQFLFSEEELRAIKNRFTEELIKASKGIRTSFPFIKNELPKVKSKQAIFQVISVGGSYIKSAIVTKTNGKIVLSDYQKKPLPLLVDKATFLKVVSENVADMPLVALNFAYALSPLIRDGKLDGRLVYPSKDHLMTGLMGQLVGEELEKYFQTTQNRKIAFVVANDTVCLLLAGLEIAPYPELVAGVVGTGMNFAFFLNERLVVNLESSHFDKFTRTETAKNLDSDTRYDYLQPLEKEVAGAYLHRHYNQLIKKHFPLEKPVLTTGELNEVAKSPSKTSYLAKILIERSASLVAMQAAAISEFKTGQNPGLKSLTFVVEGSLFWEGDHYIDIVNNYFSEFGVSKDFIKFVNIPHSNLLGAAHLV